MMAQKGGILMRIYRKGYTVLLTVAIILVMLSASIAAPILCRPFYYAHIHALDLPEKTAYTEEEIREAYDEMLDFCLFDTEFRTGILPWSEAGKAHFADCAELFRLDCRILAGSMLVLLLCGILYRRGIRPVAILGRGPLFWSGGLPLVLFAVIGGLAAMDFDRAFVLFHSLFFPGKSNWIFDPETDGIITILPEAFFRNCGILIVVLIGLISISLLAADRRKRRKDCCRTG